MKYFTYPLLRFKESTIRKRLLPLTSPHSSWMREIIDTELKRRKDSRYLPLKQITVIAKDDDEYVGWGLITIHSKRHAYYQLYVKPSYRRCGIGTKLAKRMEKYIRRIGIKQIEVAPRDKKRSIF